MIRAAITALLLACASAQGAEPAHIKFGLQDDIAPFVMPDRHGGLLLEVLRDAMATQGVIAEFAYVPANRTEDALRSGWVDVSTSAKPHMVLPGVKSRWPVTSFHNMAITLRSRLPKLDSVADLARYKVTAFRGAANLLGGGYKEAVQRNPDYTEPLTLQSPLLILGQVDVVISQRDIFHYYLSRQSFQRGTETEVVYNDVLGPPNEYWFVFRTLEQRELFEKGLAALYKSGGMEKILARYHKEYGTSRDFFKPLDCQFAVPKPKSC